MGSNPGRDTCVLEQDTLYYNCFSLPTWYKWIPAWVDVDIVNEKAFRSAKAARACILLIKGAEKDCFII